MMASVKVSRSKRDPALREMASPVPRYAGESFYWAIHLDDFLRDHHV